MKKLLFLAFIAVSTLCFSQTYDLKTVESVKFFGVDYSLVKVYGANETAEQFHYIFERINDLIVDEVEKYNPSPLLKKKVYAISVNEVNEKIQKMDISNIITSEKNVSLTREDLQKAVQSLAIEPEEGVGVVFVGELLSKTNDMGYYHIVFFDMENKQIIETYKGQGKSGGFGLRNYWASTIYKMIKSSRIKY